MEKQIRKSESTPQQNPRSHPARERNEELTIESHESPRHSELSRRFSFLGVSKSVGLFSIALLGLYLLWDIRNAITTAEPSLSKEETEAFWAERIDNLAGDPDDSQLPQGALGASEQVLAATDPSEIVELLKSGVTFAQERKEEPRFLFALGRAAYAHGYETLGLELLNQAKQRGSPAASAQLGFIAAETGQYKAALTFLTEAVSKGYKGQRAKDLRDFAAKELQIDSQSETLGDLGF